MEWVRVYVVYGIEESGELIKVRLKDGFGVEDGGGGGGPDRE